MKKPLFIAALLFVATWSVSGQTWVKQNLSGVAEVSFPDQPTVNDTAGVGISSYFYATEHGYLTVVTHNLLKIQQVMVRDDELEEFYGVFVQAAVKTLERHVVQQKYIRLQGRKGLEFTTAGNSGKSSLYYHRVFLIDNIAIMCVYIDFGEPDKAAKKERKQFFKSFSIRSDK